MPYDEDLARRVREQLAGEPFEEKKMFGGLAFLLGGHMAVAASGKGGLMVRVEPAETATLLEEPGAEPFEMGGRGMTGGLRVRADAVADEDALARWVSRGLAYARSLPPK
jgi:TfoX/Sxy family transcriptional regulator of competence genes